MENALHTLLQKGIVVFDGAMGTELYKKNFFVNVSYENLCITNPAIVQGIHVAYKNAGAEVLITNTYGANRKQLGQFGLGDKVAEINAAAVALARKVAGSDLVVAGSVGPLEKFFPAKDAEIPARVEIYSEQVRALMDAKCDFIMFETLSCVADVSAALQTMVGLETDFPFVISCKFTADATLSDGTDISHVLEIVKNAAKQPDAFGVNCGIGPEPMLAVVEKLASLCPYPMIIRPNSGMPKDVDGRSISMCSPEYFATYGMRYVSLGVKAVGGCCGITPDDISNLAQWLHPMARVMANQRVFEQTADMPLQPECPMEERSGFAAKISRKQWITNVELVPPQGYSLDQTIEKARLCKESGFDAINIPDGPRASSRLSTLVTAYKIQQEVGIETILHQCCRDKNLIGMQAELLGCAQLGVNNILFITGDPPKLGAYPFASGVFDVDSIGMLKLQKRLNQGVDVVGKSIGLPTRAFMGAGADPNAIDMQREIRRTREKIQAGAQFIITQPVFDVDALLRFIEAVPEMDGIPVIAGIWPLASLRNAQFMKTEVPGVVVPDSIMERMSVPQTKEEQCKVGIEIAREAVERIRNTVAGVQVSAPFGNVRIAAAVIR